MNDEEIIGLYNRRSERAIEETANKYGGLCHSVAYDILRSEEDAEECVNDTYLSVWRSIPPEHPTSFRAFISRITRNTALDRIRHDRTKKRGGDDYDVLLGELEECIPANEGDMADNVALSAAMNSFLSSLNPVTRMVFMRRYWYMCSVRQIAREYKLTVANVNVILHRTRKKLAKHLEDEGIGL